MLSGKFEEYKQLSQFRDLKDFNNHFEQWMVDLKGKFTKGEAIALKRLVRFSASIQGVCYAKIQTIVAATHEFDGVGISRSTFKRMLTKGKDLGLLTVHHTFKKGKQSHSVYVFNPYQSISVQVEPPKDEQLNQQKESINLSKTNKIKDIRTDEPVRNNPPKIVASWVNKEFADFGSFFMPVRQIEELWRISIIHGRQFKLCSGDVLEVSMESLKCLVSKMRAKQIVSPAGFYNGIIHRRMRTKYTQDLFLSVFESA